MLKELRPAIAMFVLLTIVTGVVYPGAVTLIAQAAFPNQANGSILDRDGKPIGSELVGQYFDEPGYFWGRPSATSPIPYNAASSSGSNLGPTNPAMLDAVQARIALFQQADPENRELIPIELVTSSASGLDPHISPAAAEYQISRVARTRSVDPQQLRELIARHTHGRALGIFGEPRINVLQLNLAIDAELGRVSRDGGN